MPEGGIGTGNFKEKRWRCNVRQSCRVLHHQANGKRLPHSKRTISALSEVISSMSRFFLRFAWRKNPAGTNSSSARQSFAMDFRFAAAIYPPPAHIGKHEYCTIQAAEKPVLSRQTNGQESFVDCHALVYPHGMPCSSAEMGSVSSITVPSLPLSVMRTLPPWRRAISQTSDKPSPTPPFSRLRDLSTRKKG